MAYSDYLIKLGTTKIPLKYIRYSSYAITPQQRQDLEAARDATGVLHRTTVANRPSKIEFETPYLTNTEISALTQIFTDSFTNSAQRKVFVSYYNPETDSYLTGDFYMPDATYTIYQINGTTITYAPVRYALIEY